MSKAAYGERFSAPANVVKPTLNDEIAKVEKWSRFLSLWRKGRKKQKQVDPAIYKLTMRKGGESRPSAQQVAERCVMLMLNEAARCFDEKICSARDGDIGAVWYRFSVARWPVPLYGCSGRVKWWRHYSAPAALYGPVTRLVNN